VSPFLSRSFFGLCFLLALLQGFQPQSRSQEAEKAAFPVAAWPPETEISAVPFSSSFQDQPKSDAEQRMIRAGLVNVQEVEPSILVELKYSTTDNFVGVDVYGELERAYLQREAAAKLAHAQRYLREKQSGYRLLVYDAARPRSIQQILWDTLRVPAAEKPKYVANPNVGSIHNYGAAVDLTIAGADGTPLDMGTPYDFFGELAYPAKEAQLLRQGKLTKEQVRNRQLLREVMHRAGFTGIKTEWWHFNAFSRAKAKERFPLLE
jgi:D-alanyl-D-alanine dipeptidase